MVATQRWLLASKGGSAYEAHTFGFCVGCSHGSYTGTGAGPEFAATITEVSLEVCENAHATESSHSRDSASPVGSGAALLSGVPECAIRAPEVCPPRANRKNPSIANTVRRLAQKAQRF